MDLIEYGVRSRQHSFVIFNKISNLNKSVLEGMLLVFLL